MKKALLLLTLFLLSGCAATEVNELLIVSGVSIDLSPDGYGVTAQTADINKLDLSEMSPVIFKNTAPTIAEALTDISRAEGERVFFNHAPVIFISSELLAAEGVGHIADTLNKESRFRSSVQLIVTEGSAASLLEVTPKIEAISAFSADQIIKQSSRLLQTPDVPYYRFLNEMLEEGVDGILPYMRVSGDGPFVCGTALFRGDRLAGTLSSEQTQYLLLMRDDTKDGLLVLDDAVFKVIKSASKITCKGASAAVSVHIEAALIEGDDGRGLIPSAEKKCRENMQTVVSLLQECGCDALGLGRRINRRDPAYFRETADRRQELYASLPVEIDVKIKLTEPVKLASKEEK